jgi:hypothetical protein
MLAKDLIEQECYLYVYKRSRLYLMLYLGSFINRGEFPTKQAGDRLYYFTDGKALRRSYLDNGDVEKFVWPRTKLWRLLYET